MATQKLQYFAPFDILTLANYKATVATFGTALSALGWTLAGDAGQVNWSNIVTNIPLASGNTLYSLAINAENWRGAWVSGTTYAVNDIVTYGGLTYICQLSNSVTTSRTVYPNTAQSKSITAVTASSGGAAVYTMTSDASATNAWQGFIFVVTGTGSSNNNGTFICTASTSTSLTLSNGAATLATGLSATAASSTANVGYSSSFTNEFEGNLGVGHTIAISGFTGTNNNETIVLLASHSTFIGGAWTGGGTPTTETHSCTMREDTVPLSDWFHTSSPVNGNGHWASYNYEIWVSTGPNSTTNPIYLKFVYGIQQTGAVNNHDIVIAVGQGQTNGTITGNVYTSNLTSNAGINTGGTLYECDFCGNTDRVSFIMWRTHTGVSSRCTLVCLDRAHDQNGGDLDTYVNVLTAASNSLNYQTLFKAGVGSLFPPTATAGWPCINDNLTSSIVNGLAPPYLVFPMVGYMANPCLGAIAMHTGDFTEGSLVNVAMYGTTHTFLMTANNTATTLAGHGGAGIEWEVF